MNIRSCPYCGNDDVSLFVNTKDYSISKEDFTIVRCKNCGFTFTQNPPEEAAIGPYYESEDYISHSDTQRGLINKLYHRARQYMLTRKMRVIQQCGVHEGERVLDFGAGTGYFAHHLKRHGYLVEALEISASARAFASEHFDLTIEAPSRLFMPFESTFNAITLWHVLEHLYDPKKYLERFHQILHEDGRLILALPNCASVDAKKYGKHWAAWDTPRHLWHFEPETLKKWAEETGFDVIDMKTMPLDGFYVSLLSEKYRGNSGLTGMIAGGITGTLGWLKSLFNRQHASSIIYILRKKH